jgi:hypothetical protein
VTEIEKLEVGHGWHFICRDCGRDIYSFGVNPEIPVCAMCRWIAEFGHNLTEAEKLEIRER